MEEEYKGKRRKKLKIKKVKGKEEKDGGVSICQL
jgi:hypothetical protein